MSITHRAHDDAGSLRRDGAAPQRRSRRRRAVMLGSLGAISALTISACGSSPTKSPTAASTSGSGSGSQSPSSGGQQLMASITSLEAQPAFTPPGPSLDAKKLPSSTKVVVIDNTPSVGPLQQASAGAVAAAEAVGITPKVLNGGANNTPSDDINLLEQAVNMHPQVVIQVGIITALETAGVNYAQAHGVPVIAVADNQPVAGAPGEGSGAGIAGTAAPDFAGEGKAIADYIGATGPSDAQIGVITSNDIVPSNESLTAFKTELAKVCPHCTLVTQNVDTASWSTDVTPTVTSMLDSHPTMNFLFPIVDGMAPLVTPALSSSSHHVKVVSINATPGAAMGAVASGQFNAEVGASAGLEGWYAFDAALRTMLKQPSQTDPTEPMTFFTTSEMAAKHLNPNSDTSLFGDAYVAGFKHLWGVG